MGLGVPEAIVGSALLGAFQANKSSKSARRSAEASAGMISGPAQQLFDQTNPLRDLLIGQSQNFLQGGVDQSPEFAALKSAIEGQYGQAKENLIGSTPAGGALTEALTGLEGARAGQMVQGMGNIYGRNMDRSLSLATGTPLAASLQGFSNAGSIQGQLAASQAAQAGAAKQGIGFGLGSMLGNKPPATSTGTVV